MTAKESKPYAASWHGERESRTKHTRHTPQCWFERTACATSRISTESKIYRADTSQTPRRSRLWMDGCVFSCIQTVRQRLREAASCGYNSRLEACQDVVSGRPLGVSHAVATTSTQGLSKRTKIMPTPCIFFRSQSERHILTQKPKRTHLYRQETLTLTPSAVRLVSIWFRYQHVLAIYASHSGPFRLCPTRICKVPCHIAV